MAADTLTATTVFPNRQRIGTGIALIVLGLLMFVLFVTGTQPGQTATFGMNRIRTW